jgi:AcrR family transcriptional regulator
MTRPSQNIDKQLLGAGRKLLPETGISGLSVRALCKKAGVNLGMFNYHFGTMEKYIEALITEIYNEFYKDFTLESETGKDPMEKLRNALISGAFFVRDNRMIVLVFLEEMLRGNKKLLNFAKKNMTKHISVVFRLLKDCQKQGYAVKSSIFAVAPILIGGVVLPNIAVRVLEKNYGDMFFGAAVPFLKNSLLSDKIIIERIDLVLRAVSTEKKDDK